MYFHGYGSAFNPGSKKVVALEKLGTVSGINLDYGRGSNVCIDAAISACLGHDIDLVVGCSMGGWLASHVGSRCGIPFVALNPAIQPSISLTKSVGKVVNFKGIDRVIEKEVVAEYPDIAKDGCGLILCEEDDDVIDPRTTIKALEGHYRTFLFPGGSHRFESLAERLPLIEDLVVNAGLVYGSAYLE